MIYLCNDLFCLFIIYLLFCSVTLVIILPYSKIGLLSGERLLCTFSLKKTTQGTLYSREVTREVDTHSRSLSFFTMCAC